MSNKDKVTLIILALSLLGVGIFTGYNVKPTTVAQAYPIIRTEYVEKMVYLERILEIPAVQEVIVTKEIPIYVEVKKEVLADKFIPQKEFESVIQCQEWLNNVEHELPVVMYADNSGVIRFNVESKSDARYDCDDYATDLENLALRDGWKLYPVPVINGSVWGINVTSISGYHVGNWTKIQGSYYYIEASPCSNRWQVVRIASAD